MTKLRIMEFEEKIMLDKLNITYGVKHYLNRLNQY